MRTDIARRCASSAAALSSSSTGIRKNHANPASHARQSISALASTVATSAEVLTTTSFAAPAYLGTNSRHHNNASASSSLWPTSLGALVVASALAMGITTTRCDSETSTLAPPSSSLLTPAQIVKQDFQAIVASHSIDDLPVYTADQVAKNDGSDGTTPIWMTYGGVVYDVTNFVRNHPGGAEKILQAAGSAIEPFWYTYRQHFSSDLPMQLMEQMAIGRLHDDDQEAIDEQMVELEKVDPYAREPKRDSMLKVHSDTPMNAEVPSHVLTQSYLTPNDLFYIRHHHPVPYLTAAQMEKYRLTVDVSAYVQAQKEREQPEVASSMSSDTATDPKQGQEQSLIQRFTVDDLKRNFKRTEVTVTLQCSGNRRSGFNSFQRTSGTPWGQGAVSTATFAGARLSDVLKAAGLDDAVSAQDDYGLEHVRFTALDGMAASIDIEKAASPYGDCIVAYEMNGEPLPRDHGSPLRIIVPGYAAVRNVKWVDRIELAATEAEGPWQRGLNYKTLPPSVTDANAVNLSQMPSMTEVSLFSGITQIERVLTDEQVDGAFATDQVTPTNESSRPGDTIPVRVKGWAWAGGGRNIVRVDVTGDNGTTWATATLREGSHQRFHRAWAWVFWDCILPVTVQPDGTVHVASKAVDLAFNVQPESSDPTWNVRGLGNNSWYRAHAKVVD